MLGLPVALGATYSEGSTTFRVWAPSRERVELVLHEGAVHRMHREPGGYYAVTVPGVPVGALYRFRVDGEGPFPDPASRFQPDGVHGPSMVVDPSRYRWTDAAFTGIALEDLVIYELHLGTFTPEGTFSAAADRLGYLKELGVSAVELMPIADFPGRWNWGYDGVAPFAPARCYGTPDDLRALVDRAHELGIAVLLDVVYNHFGPDGAYQGVYSKQYYSTRHRSPWGDGINFDGEGSAAVRDYFLENALRWISEYHFDGLRLDAVHAIEDDSARHIVAAIAAAVRAAVAESGKRVLVIAEDSRNLAFQLYAERDGGWELDGVWADDFHHQVRRGLAGDSEGYFRPFDGSAAGIAQTARQGWFRMGTDPAGLAYAKFVLCIQNHDQIGNRAFGDRLHHTISGAAYRAASALLLLLPETPLLFMGQEWAATTPFQYFTDHHQELGKLVSAGRRREFSKFSSFAHEVPDPQAESTFTGSRLIWEERLVEPHASTYRLYRDLLALRREHAAEPGLRSPELQIEAQGTDALVLRRRDLAIAVALRGAPRVELPEGYGEILLSTEDARYTSDPLPPEYMPGSGFVQFQREGVIVLAWQGKEDLR